MSKTEHRQPASTGDIQILASEIERLKGRIAALTVVSGATTLISVAAIYFLFFFLMMR